jgi:hypothetical protein
MDRRLTTRPSERLMAVGSFLYSSLKPRHEPSLSLQPLGDADAFLYAHALRFRVATFLLRVLAVCSACSLAM